MSGKRQKVFAQRAWLGPARFAQRILVEFDSRIRAVRELRDDEQPPEDATVVQWLIPGLVNAHCHLEYTWLEGAGLPRGAVPFGEWMRAIIAKRPQDENDLEQRAQAMHDGTQRLIAGGCTTVIDSTTDGSSGAALHEAGLRHYLFHEVLGLTRERAEPIWNAAHAWLRQLGADGQQGECPGLVGAGLNPHAPYSVGEWLREQLRSADAARWPQAWHLAETADEEELFRKGTGSVAGFLQEVGLPLPNQRFDSSFDFLKDAGLLGHCGLVFHGNELSVDEARFFSAPRGVVHCPGTHRWFERRRAPLREWLDAGVNVCLGTDSLASAESLSMLDVVRMTLEDHPELSVDDVLTMACVNPWRLGFMAVREGRDGGGPGINVGMAADLVGMIDTQTTSVDSEVNENWRTALISSGPAKVGVWINGIAMQQW